MTTFPIYQEELSLNMFKKGELPLYMVHYRLHGGYPNHHHEFVEMSLVTAGSGTGIFNGVEYVLKPGSICLLLPHHLHALKMEDGQTLQKFCCMFDLNLLFQPDFAEIGQWLIKLTDDLSPYYTMSPEALESIKTVMFSLLSEYGSNGLGKQGLMRIKLLEVIYLFFRSHPSFLELPQPIVPQPEEWEYVKYVNTHFLEESLSLEVIASRFGVSIYVVRNSFKRLLGRNFLDYLHMLRVRRASNLLAATDMSVSEIAYDVGFSSLRSFTRVFKESTGMSASDFRVTHAVTDR